MYISGELYQIEDDAVLDAENSTLFEKMVDYLQGNGICVIFYLPPYHPYVYNYIKENSDYEMVLKAEEYFRTLALEKGIEVYGSYDPGLLECKNEDFFDGMHMKRDRNIKAWKRLAGRG